MDQFVDLLYLRLGVSNIPLVFVALDAFVVVLLISLSLSLSLSLQLKYQKMGEIIYC
jgi:uncharacterized integral membrane protein